MSKHWRQKSNRRWLLKWPQNANYTEHFNYGYAAAILMTVLFRSFHFSYSPNRASPVQPSHSWNIRLSACVCNCRLCNKRTTWCTVWMMSCLGWRWASQSSVPYQNRVIWLHTDTRTLYVHTRNIISSMELTDYIKATNGVRMNLYQHRIMSRKCSVQ